MTNRKLIFVGLSGGVDSAVSATLLKQQGHDVVGVFIRTWHPDFLECNEEAERLDAMRVAAHLDIPFLTFDLESVYKKEVADYMIAEYRAGRTPNPDVMCNKYVKFGAFFKKALSMGADYVATGHYAQSFEKSIFLGLPTKVTSALEKHSLRNLKNSGAKKTFLNGDVAKQDNPEKKNFLLLKSKDDSKDQSYFLWTLNQKQLSKILFPIGHLQKKEVRKLAKKFKLPVAEKKDSQGICFLGAVDLKKFLKHYIKEKKGKVLNIAGETIGHHQGVFFSTLGERHGFTITKKTPNDKPYYVVGKDIKKNILYVYHHKTENHSKVLTSIRVKNINWINGAPEAGKIYHAQIRYHGEFLSCKVEERKILFEKPVLVASGQSAVLYDKEVCLGGGVVV